MSGTHTSSITSCLLLLFLWYSVFVFAITINSLCGANNLRRRFKLRRGNRVVRSVRVHSFQTCSSAEIENFAILSIHMYTYIICSCVRMFIYDCDRYYRRNARRRVCSGLAPPPYKPYNFRAYIHILLLVVLSNIYFSVDFDRGRRRERAIGFTIIRVFILFWKPLFRSSKKGSKVLRISRPILCRPEIARGLYYFPEETKPRTFTTQSRPSSRVNRTYLKTHSCLRRDGLRPNLDKRTGKEI